MTVLGDALDTPPADRCAATGTADEAGVAVLLDPVLINAIAIATTINTPSAVVSI